MKIKFVPIIMMLSAGLIDCILGIYYHLGIYEYLIQLLIVLVVFYFIGDMIRFLWMKFMVPKEEDADASEETAGADNPEEGQEPSEGENFRETMENIESEEVQE